MKSLQIFQRKTLRGFLKLSQSSPIPAIHFLLGELPVEGMLHIRTLGIFHNIWSNPTTTVYTIVKYVLTMCNNTSTTWSNHVQIICRKYGLPPPLSLLSMPAWPKTQWDTLVKTRITAWHESSLRSLAEHNSKMKYLNVQLHGLSGRAHPANLNIRTTQDVKKLRLHLKFLTCDILNDTSSAGPACSLCKQPSAGADPTEHVLVSCQALSEVRGRIFPQLMNAVSQVQPMSGILAYNVPPPILTQFILDCTSLNLPDSIRIPAHNPRISELYRISRDWCFAIASERTRRLGQLK